MTTTRSRLSINLVLVVALTAVWASLSLGQKRAIPGGPRPFEPAEELLFEAEFSRAFLRKVDIADFRLTAVRVTPPVNKTSEASTSETTGPYILQFTGEAKSKGFFARLFNIHFLERVISIVEPASFTVQNTKRFDEQGSRVRSSEAVYDQSNGKVVWTEHDPKNPTSEPRVASATFNGQIQDVLSAIYFLRTQPLEIGRSFEIPITDSGRVYQIPVHVIEKRRRKTVLGRVDVLHLDVELFGPKGMVDTAGRFSIWLTADHRHIPVSAKIKHEFGTFDIKLKKIIQSPAVLNQTKQS
ncbi:MAG TPA: DUF3108 domain-containing protein [Pyrinomonadaceae bacterium]|nr:DUF3108 domain-containing protein [Pyrinomonadaceae bacterium]